VASDPDHLSSLLVGDAMSSELVTTREDTSLVEALRVMQERGIRRLPIIDHDGGLVGIVTFDDVVRFFARELGELVQLLAHQEQLEERYRV
jgi:CBS domain-containing protein